MAASISEEERQWAAMLRQDARARMRYLLSDGAIVCLPTTPFPAPPRDMSLSEQSTSRLRISCLCSHGGLTGVPQVSIPVAMCDGLPVGLSILGAAHTDATLVGVAGALMEALND